MLKTIFLILFVSVGMSMATPYVHPLGRARSQRTDFNSEKFKTKSQGLDDASDEQLLAPKTVAVRDDSRNEEPSCDQLKAMWRFSKRQARAPELLNDIVPYTDPFTNNKWPVYPITYPIVPARPRLWNSFGSRASLRNPAPFGKVINIEPKNRAAIRPSSFDVLYGVLSEQDYTGKMPQGEVRSGGVRIFNAPPQPQKGKFQKLKELIQTERARELKQQREAEQLAARAMLIKEIANGKNVDNKNLQSYEDNSLQSLDNQQLADEPVQSRNRNRQQQSLAGLQFSRYGQSHVPVSRRDGYYGPALTPSAPEFYPDYPQAYY